jgi:hypothetical protein
LTFGVLAAKGSTFGGAVFTSNFLAGAAISALGGAALGYGAEGATGTAGNGAIGATAIDFGATEAEGCGVDTASAFGFAGSTESALGGADVVYGEVSTTGLT